MAEPTIESRLIALGEALRFADVDVLSADVVAALEGLPVPGQRSRRRRLLLLAAAIVLCIVGVVAAVPDSRHAVARWLGFDDLRIERVDRLPDVPPADLGPTMTLDEAGVAVGIAPRVATGLGEPLSVHAPAGRSVAVRYRDGTAEVLVATLPGRLDGGLFGKLVGSGAEVRPLDLDGRPAYWITGPTHVFMYIDADGEIGEARPADDTLVWQDGDAIVRVEGEIGLERARAIAAGVTTS